MRRPVQDNLLNNMNMPKRFLIFFMLFLGYQVLPAQDNDDCIYLLEDAREAYKAGMVELVPDLLLECIESNGFLGRTKNEAYRLVINSYLSDYLTDEADSLMDIFLADFPAYRAQDSDPENFVFLLNTHLRARGIDPDLLPEYTESVVEVDSVSERKRRVITKGAGEFGNSAGLLAGVNFSLPSIVEAYSMGDPTLDESRFGILPGLQAGFTANLILKEKLEISFGLQYDLSRFTYKSTPLSFTSYRYVESEHHLLLPLSVIYKLNPENRVICYYLRGGVIPSYMQLATGKGSRTNESLEEGVLVEPTDITSSRKPLNLQLMAGAGLRIPMSNAFFFLEARICSGLLLSNNEENRYQSNDIEWLLYHVDSDFRKHQLSICGGICWDLTKQ
jgi:Outer membrane protein beta-barrel domain